MENPLQKSVLFVSALTLLALVTVSYRSGTLLGQAAPAEYLVDNHQQGFSKQGGWYAYNSSLCLNGSCVYGTRTAGTATWTFPTVPPGAFEVWGYWPTFTSLMKSVPVKVSDANGILENYQIYQEGPNAQGMWRLLGHVTVRSAPVTISIDTRLSSGGYYVMADAFKLVPKGCDEACQKQKIVSLIRSIGGGTSGYEIQARKDALETAIRRATEYVNSGQYDAAYDINGDGYLTPVQDINRLVTYLNNREGPLCGDGIVQGENSEACDDGNNRDGDGCTFRCGSEAPYGDVTGDGKVSSLDTAKVQRHVLGLEKLPEDRLAFADVDRNGTIDRADVYLISGRVVGLIPLPSVFGDASGDGILNAQDATLILDHVEGRSQLSSGRQYVSDVNIDGTVTALDAVLVREAADNRATLPELCGNGKIETQWNEQCDDGNRAGGDGCSQACVSECDDACIRRNVEALTERRSAETGAPMGMKMQRVLEEILRKVTFMVRGYEGGTEEEAQAFDVNRDGQLSNADRDYMIAYLESTDANLCGNGALQTQNQEACDDGIGNNQEDSPSCNSVCLIGPTQRLMRFINRDRSTDISIEEMGRAAIDFINSYGNSGNGDPADFDGNGVVNEQDLLLLKKETSGW